MKFLIVFAVAVACAAADVSHLEAAAPILKSNYNIEPNGAYQYEYETGNGIVAQATGVPKNVQGEFLGSEVTGGYKYSAPDGTPVSVSYIANENGFQPQGDHLPVSPPIPVAILRSLEYIRANAPKQYQ